jgi:predicted nuclease of predicted toxin-antitoxin system
MYAGLKDYFEVMGWGVETIQESGLEGVTDREVAEYAKENDLLLITEDRKPAELASLLDVKFCFLDAKTKAKFLEQMIYEKYPDIKK